MWCSPRITLTQLAGLCRRVAISLEAGIDIRNIWAREAGQAGGLGLRSHLEMVSRAVNAGETLAAALALTADFFPPLLREMVAVGEETGRLAEVFAQLADHYQQQIKLRRIFLAAITWPVTQLVIALFMVGLLIWFLGAIGARSGYTVDMLGLGLTGTRGLVLYLALLTVIGLFVAFFVHAVRQGLVWTRPLERAALKIPVLGPALEVLALARLTWALHLTFGAGMDVRRALHLSLRSAQNARYADQIPAVDRAIASGSPVYEAFVETGSYPAEFLDTLQVGEQGGRLTEAMETLSRQYRDRARTALVTLTTLAGFGVWCFVAMLIIAIVFRLFLSYLAMLANPMGS